MDYSPANTSLPTGPSPTSRDPGNAPFVLTPPDIREFQQLVQEHCGVLLTDTEAWNRATELVALYRMFLGSLPEDPAITDQCVFSEESQPAIE
jgi:hypothetical protein